MQEAHTLAANLTEARLLIRSGASPPCSKRKAGLGDRLVRQLPNTRKQPPARMSSALASFGQLPMSRRNETPLLHPW